MRQLMLCAWLLNVAMGVIDAGSFGRGFPRGRNGFREGRIGGRKYGDRIGGESVSSDGEGGLDKAYVNSLQNEITELIEKANSTEGISSAEIKSSGRRIKYISKALLRNVATSNVNISKEAVNNLLLELTANFSSVTPIEVLNAGPFDDEAYRVSITLCMLKKCADEIQSLEANDENFGIYLKAVYRLAKRLIRSAYSADELIMVTLYNRDTNKRNFQRRKEGPWSVGGEIRHDPQTGWGAGANLAYEKGNFRFDANANYNQQSGTSYGAKATWSFG